MPRWLALALATSLFAALGAPLAGAQEPAPPVRVVRPPEGSLRRGALPVPGWIALAGGAALAGAAGYSIFRASRR